MKTGAFAIIIHDRCVLVAQRSDTEHEPRSWSLFGGMAEPGEDPTQALLREVQEEAGIDLTPYQPELVSVWNEPGTDFHAYTYAVVIPTDHLEPKITLSPETRDFCWAEVGDTPATFWQRVENLHKSPFPDARGPLHSGFAQLVADHGISAKVLDLIQ